jgi:protein gp37
MNRTKIEWTDYTWNPVTGCWGPGGAAEKPNRCQYCYAGRIANRFHDRYPDIDPFAPTFYHDRLSQPAKVKKPSKIFVVSMGDLFGDWVPDEWIFQVGAVAYDNPHHTFQFLTKNPARYQEFNPWPANCWVGATITNQVDADERVPELLKADAAVRFVSHEPLLGPIDFSLQNFNKMTLEGREWGKATSFIQWAIIGAMTGPGAVEVRWAWVQGLIDQYRAAGVPVFLKDNLHWLEKIQEFPEASSRIFRENRGLLYEF